MNRHKILNEIYDFCEDCPSHDCCPENDCVLFRIEKQCFNKDKYFIIMQDEWFNLDFLGVYNKLENALPDINLWLKPYNVEIDSLYTYSSVYGECFDKEIDIDCDYGSVWVRGFVISDEDLDPID